MEYYGHVDYDVVAYVAAAHCSDVYRIVCCSVCRSARGEGEAVTALGSMRIVLAIKIRKKSTTYTRGCLAHSCQEQDPAAVRFRTCQKQPQWTICMADLIQVGSGGGIS